MTKVLDDRTFKTNDIDQSYQLYLIFYLYYNETALKWSVDNWQEILSIFIDYNDKFYNRDLEEGLTMLSDIDHQTLTGESFLFDYNRLFIGPDKLLAPPYESSYRSAERVLMQEETLAVRDFYRSVGLEVKQKNVIPDDHLSLELELTCYLLSKAIETGDQKYYDFYEQFFNDHLSKWLLDHCRDVIGNSYHFICKGMGKALLGFIEKEQEQIQLRKGD